MLDSHFGTVTKIASEELEFTICDSSYTSCEAENGKKDYFEICIDLNELIQYNLPVEIENRQYCICMHIKKWEMIEIIHILSPEPMIQTNSGTQHFVMKSDFQQLLNGECFGDNVSTKSK